MPTINEHIKKIYADSELEESATIRNFRIVQTGGSRQVKEIELLYKGYDKSRDSQRYGFHPKYEDKRIFRITLKTDPRIFTKVARNSKK